MAQSSQYTEFDAQIKKQDVLVDKISLSLDLLHKSAINIGDELDKQTYDLDDLTVHVTNTDSRLKSVTDRIRKLIRDNNHNCGFISCVCMIILAIVLIILVIWFFA
jgi:hypothetical protein